MSKLDRLTAYRIARGYRTAKEFAAFLGISASQISEVDKKENPANLILALTNKTDINIDWWETGEGEMFIQPENANKPYVSDLSEPYQKQEDERTTDEVEKMIIRKMRKRGQSYMFRWLAEQAAEEEAESNNNPAP